MGLTAFPNGVSSFGSPLNAQPPLWLPNGGTAYFVGGPNGSDNNVGTDYDNPLQRISAATVNKVKNSSTGSVVAGTRGSGDFVYVSTGVYAENVRVIQRDYVRIVGAGKALVTIKAGDTPTSANTDALGQSQTITLTNQTTQMTDWAFIIGSRGVVICGMTIGGTGNANGAVGGIYIGDGYSASTSGSLNSTNNWGSSQFRIFDIEFDGGGPAAGGWAIAWQGFGPGGIIENCHITRWGSGGLLVNDGGQRPTSGGIFRNNMIVGCRGYGIRRSNGVVGGGNAYINNFIMDEGGNALTNGILLGSIGGGTGDFVAGNYGGTSNAFISTTSSADRNSGNYTSTAGNSALTYGSMT